MATPAMIEPSAPANDGMDLAGASMEGMVSARMRLQIRDPFLGAASLYLKMEARPLSWFQLVAPWTAPTACTEGEHIFFYPPYVAALPPGERLYLVAHEAYHAVALDPFRRGSRNPVLWNMAVDYRLNCVLKSAGWEIPSDVLYDAKYNGLSAEEIYDLLKKELEAQGKKVPEGGGQGGGFVIDPQAPDGRALDSNAREALARQWGIRAAQCAEVAKQAGKLPGDYQRLVQETLEPKVPWQEVLRRFIRDARSRLGEDYQWHPANRRHLWRGLQYPSRERVGMGLLDIHVDLSGSIGEKELAEFITEIQGIRADASPELTRVIYFDTRVTQVDELEADAPLRLEGLKGRGGTDLGAAFRWARESGRTPVLTVVLTDLYGPFEEQAPREVVIWCISPGGSKKKPPYGEVVRIEESERS